MFLSGRRATGVLCRAALLSALAGAAACAGGGTTGPGSTIIADITVTPDPAAVAAGDTVHLAATARDSGGRSVGGVTIGWSTSDTLRARVSPTGVLTGLSAGLDTVIAAVGRVSARVPVNVSASGSVSVARVPLGVGGIGCLLSPAGAASCWGFGPTASLGNGTTNTSATPVPVSGGHIFAAISVGPWGSCALTPAGAAWCWGSGSEGGLGNGQEDSGATVPSPVPGGPFSVIAAGQLNACAIAARGQAYCWGYGYYGALGDGMTTNALTPTAVSGGLDLASISIGEDVGCGVTVAGGGYCWGTNTLGSLGTGTTTTSYVSVPVSGGLTWRTIQVSAAATCGLTTSDEVYCWGLGAQDGADLITRPSLISGALTFASITMGGDQACGLTAAGVAYCWGGSQYGERGTGGSPQATAVPEPVLGGLTFAAIAAGYTSTCGRTTDGAVYCWGQEYGTNTFTTPAKTTQSPVELVGPGST